MKKETAMKAIKNIRELELMKEKLEYQVLFYEKEMVGNSASIVDNITDKLKDAAFDLGLKLLIQLFTPSRKKSAESKEHKKE